ncbi:MAG: polysaccharide biosynthesis tyrosine autokinase [Bacteroidia bacterium]|nr:polysaccharide biosynthesis tyrosine autokinase [Bacteroidia bacterium]
MNDTQQFNREPAEESIDLRKWAGRILTNWYWFVLSVAIFGSSAYLLTRYSVPQYYVQATLLVQQDKKSAGGIQLFQDMDLFGQQKNIQNEIGIVKSWTLARRALGELNLETTCVVVGRWTERQLYDYIPFKVTTGPNPQYMAGVKIGVTILSDTEYQLEIDGDHNINVKQQFNQPYQNGNFNFIVSLNPNFDPKSLPNFLRTNKYYFVVNNLDRLAYSFQARLGVALTDKMSSMLKLSIQGPNGRQAVDYLNTLMKEYIQSSLDLKNQTAANTVKFIDDQLSGLKDTLKEAEISLQDFRSRNKVINISAEGTTIMNEIDRLAQEKALSDIQVQYYSYLLNYLKSNENFANIMAPSTMGISDQMLTSLISTLVQLSNEKTSLEYSAKENNPALVKVNMLIKNNQETLTENVKNIVYNAKLKQTDVNRRITRLNSRIQELPATERQLATITRKFELQNSIYTFLLQRRAEAGITQAANVPDQMIIDQARADAVYKVSPKNYRNYAIGVLLGLFFPMLILILKDFLNHSVQEKSDVERLTNVPIIGTIGHNKRDNKVPSIVYPRSSIAESFRAVRTNLQFSLFEEGHKVVMVTSSTSGEGKSFVALNMAGIFSVSNKKAVVVGLDLRKPTIQKFLDFPNKEGVSTYIIGRSTLDNIINPTEFPNLSVITSGPVPPNPAELFETKQFAELINELRARFDYIILDTPPVALVTDAMLIARHADATLFVVRQKYTHRSALSFVDEMKNKPHIKHLSILINDVVVPKYYGYKYGYGYGYGYGKGYGSGYYTDDK